MNKVTIIGRLTDAPIERTTPSGTPVVSFKIAVNRRFNREQTDFIPVVAWRQLGELCTKYLVKGQQAAVTGELHIESYEDSEGTRRTRVEVVADDVEFLARPAEQKPAAAPAPKPEKVSEPEDLFVVGQTLDDEELPF